jgi:tRNA U34 2-thiouridine synthase MnmA/TrmU
MTEMKKKAVILLSGGLDSTLAAKMMVDQGIDLTAVHFTSLFCNCTPRKAGCKLQAAKVSEELHIPIRVIQKGMDYIRIVEKPPHGHGSGMNPCIDCRIYMLRKVKALFGELDASFVITGEVLAQRPMSQHRHTIGLIERESGLDGLILRPLSAIHFDPTLPELAGVVDRKRLLSFSGRSRKPQIELARELGIQDYPCPAGGCLLTDKEMAARLRDLFAHVPDYDMADLHLLKVGRHFRLDPQRKVIVGRTQEDNEKIKTFAKPGSLLFSPSGFRGPTVHLRGTSDEATEVIIGRIIARYSQDQRPEYPIRKIIVGGEESLFTVRDRIPAVNLDTCRIS